MRRHLRNLLWMAALCWVAPASAQQIVAEVEAAPQWDPSGCPEEQAARQKIIITSDEAVGEVPVSASRRAFFP